MDEMATQKVSVTLDADVLERVRAAVGPRGLSSYVDRALAGQLERDERSAALLALLDEAEVADPTPDDVAARARARAERIRAAIAP